MNNNIKSIFTLNNFCKFFYGIITLVVSIFMLNSINKYNNRQNVTTYIQEYEFKEKRIKDMGDEVFEFITYTENAYKSLEFFISNSCLNKNAFAGLLEENSKLVVKSISNAVLSKNIFNEKVFVSYAKLYGIYIGFYQVSNAVIPLLRSNNFDCQHLKKLVKDLKLQKQEAEDIYKEWLEVIQDNPFKKDYYKSI